MDEELLHSAWDVWAHAKMESANRVGLEIITPLEAADDIYAIVPSSVTWEVRDVRRHVHAVAVSVMLLTRAVKALLVNCCLIPQSWPRISSLSFLVTQRPSPATMAAVGPVRRSFNLFSTST
jgi:hypothetical protein